jgi:O-acetyl-ADP-ribose deacetylase (regulator of RNase III)
MNIKSSTLEVIQGDITTLAVDAIVNAAKNSLGGGGGVDGAIHRVAGPSIKRECEVRYPQGCKTGEAVITSGGNLLAKHIIHTVGPVWHGGKKGEPELLASCWNSCLKLAVQEECQSIAFCSISTGIFGYPVKLAAPIAIIEVKKFLEALPQGCSLNVIVCAYSENDQIVYSRALKQ